MPNLSNCTVTVYQAIEFENDSISAANLEQQAIPTDFASHPALSSFNGTLPQGAFLLVIEADPNYTISHDNITISNIEGANLDVYPYNNRSWASTETQPPLTYSPGVPSEIQSVTIFNSDYNTTNNTDGSTLENKVLALVVLVPDFQMPANSLTLNIDFDGAAVPYVGENPLYLNLRSQSETNGGGSSSFIGLQAVNSWSNGADYTSSVVGCTNNYQAQFIDYGQNGASFVYGSTQVFLDVYPSNRGISFDLSPNDGVSNGNFPEYIYVKVIGYTGCDIEGYVDFNNVNMVYEIPSNPNSVIVGDIFETESVLNTVTGDTDNVIQNVIKSEIFPNSGYGSSTSAILFKIPVNPNWLFLGDLFSGEWGGQDFNYGIIQQGFLKPKPIAGLELQDVISQQSFSNTGMPYRIELINR
tara:strand:+ start:1282 stop:2523 length:1242 start_codon:yes stop_codon:yes gene_type:complete